MIKKILSLMFLLSVLFSSAQENATGPQMADNFRSEGKIYVVITVIAIVFAALVVFLIAIERKVKKIEKQINKE